MSPINQLLDILKLYDEKREKIENEGGVYDDLFDLSEILQQKFKLSTSKGRQRTSLDQPEELCAAIQNINQGELFFQIRKGHSGLPLYYLCRTKSDNYCSYKLIIEDIYKSSNFPIEDERFVLLYLRNREQSSLRLSQFRSQLITSADNPDEQLYSMGRYIFQNAWHEDQYPALVTADLLELDYFPQTLELLYLILSGNLYELRNAIGIEPIIKHHLKIIYPEKAITKLICSLQARDISEIKAIASQAQVHFCQLENSFTKLLQSPLFWGYRNRKIPLFKIIYGNFFRADKIKNDLAKKEDLHKAKYALEEKAKTIMQSILD